MLVSPSISSKHGHRKYLIALFIGILIGGNVIAGLLIIKRGSDKPPVTGSQYTKGEGANSSKSSNSSGGASGNSTASIKDNSNAGTTFLIAPSGDFVSNHRPNLSGQPAPNKITSVCNTTPNASCQIVFTKDGTVKKLPAQTTDSGGTAYWNNWSLSSIGLSAGSWQIHAVATLNGQTKTASDILNIEVAE